MPHIFLLGIVYLSFISLGLPDGVLGVAWPAIRADMGQPLAAVGYVTITITLCAAFSSAHAGALAQRLGTGLVVAVSCLLTSLALLARCLSLVSMVVRLMFIRSRLPMLW